MSLAGVPGRMIVDGLYILQSSHQEGFTRRLPRPLPLYANLFYTRLTIHLLNSAGPIFLLITTNGQASADTDKIRYSMRPNAISASIYVALY